MKYLITYLIFAGVIATLYSHLYTKRYMPDTVKEASFKQKINVYIMLWGSIFITAPYGLYEIIKEFSKEKGGSKQ